MTLLPLGMGTGTAGGTRQERAGLRSEQKTFGFESYNPDNSIFRMQIRPDQHLYCLYLTYLAEF